MRRFINYRPRYAVLAYPLCRGLVPAMPWAGTRYPVDWYPLSRGLVPAIPWAGTRYPVGWYPLSRVIIAIAIAIAMIY
ncbi:hypothetical protein E05_51440 (plasmid) [Plautia stali symbiont]|nr:hypothetical protein E05_51440 [Plautia stali symbiont]